MAATKIRDINISQKYHKEYEKRYEVKMSFLVRSKFMKLKLSAAQLVRKSNSLR